VPDKLQRRLLALYALLRKFDVLRKKHKESVKKKSVLPVNKQKKKHASKSASVKKIVHGTSWDAG
jgi:hypothetical protein